MAIKENIIYFMKKTGYKKSDIAKLSGIPYTTLDGILKKGDENIKLSTLKKLSTFMSCTLDELIQDNLENDDISSSNKDINSEDSVFKAFAEKYHLSDAEQELAKYCLSLTSEQRKEILNSIRQLSKILSLNNNIELISQRTKPDHKLTPEEKRRIVNVEIDQEEKATTSSASTGTNGM